MENVAGTEVVRHDKTSMDIRIHSLKMHKQIAGGKMIRVKFIEIRNQTSLADTILIAHDAIDHVAIEFDLHRPMDQGKEQSDCNQPG